MANREGVRIVLIRDANGFEVPALRDMSGRERSVLPLRALFGPGQPTALWRTNVCFAGIHYLVGFGMQRSDRRPGKLVLTFEVEGELLDRDGLTIGFLQRVQLLPSGHYKRLPLLAVATEQSPAPWERYQPADLTQPHITAAARYRDGTLMPVLLVYHPPAGEAPQKLKMVPFSEAFADQSLLGSQIRDSVEWSPNGLPEGLPQATFRVSRVHDGISREPYVQLDGIIHSGLTQKFSQQRVVGARATRLGGDPNWWVVAVRHEGRSAKR